MTRSLSTPVTDLILLPYPRSLVRGPGQLLLNELRAITVAGRAPALRRIAEQVSDSVAVRGGVRWPVRPAGAGRRGCISLAVDREQVRQAQGYRLEISRSGVSLIGADEAGLFYGAMTLLQLLRQVHCVLPALVIRDHPDFPVRGVMLDISRDKVPTMATLQALVDRLAEWKINHLELYTEHTFAYSGHREIWKDASPMTAAEIRRLDAYCRDRFIELVPNQNSFGHLDRWLTHPDYIGLAEAPEGGMTPWGHHVTHANSLNPADPRSLALIEGLYAELLPNFTSRKFNVGCDETWDLGQGKCKELCAQRGKGRVYLDFLLKIADLVKKHGRTMHFWGDIIVHYPELVAEIPRDVVVMEWGYEADHPFDEHGAKFAASGIPFYVCPGTSAWNSLAGRTANALENLECAARYGLKHGAIGYLNTDWGDGGHWQYLPVSYLGWAAGAAFAWSLKGNRRQDWRRVLDVQVFEDQAGVMGGLAYDLGNTYLRTGHQIGNGSILNTLVAHKNVGWVLEKGVTEATLANCRGWIDGVMSRLPAARMSRRDARLIGREFENTARLMRHACDRGTLLARGDRATPADRAALADDMKSIIEEHRSLWLARNRPGGLRESAGRMEARVKEYLS